MWDYDEVFAIFYDADNNYFVDEDGYIIYDIFNIITSNDVFLFKQHKEYRLVPYVLDKSIGVEIFFPDGEYGGFPDIVESRAQVYARIY